MKLNPQDLVVTSFDTVAAAGGTDTVHATRPVDPFDPTPNTYCDDCPVGTAGC